MNLTTCHRYGYKDTEVCTECAGNMGLAFVPGAFLLVAVIIAIIIFCRGGGEVVNMETVLEGGSTAALKAKALEKGDETTAEAIMAVESRAAAAPNAKWDIKNRLAKLISRVAKFSVKFKILVSLWQILQGIGAAFSIPFPPFYEQVVSTVSGVLQIELPAVMPLDCIIATSYYSKLAFKCIWPLIAYAVFGVSSKLFRKCGKVDQADSCINFGFFVMFVIYPSVSSGWAACPPSRLFVLPSCIRGHACIRLASCTPGHAYPGLVSALIIIAQLAPNQAPVDVLLCGARGRHGMAARRPLPRVQHRSEPCIRTNNLLSARSSTSL